MRSAGVLRALDVAGREQISRRPRRPVAEAAPLCIGPHRLKRRGRRSIASDGGKSSAERTCLRRVTSPRQLDVQDNAERMAGFAKERGEAALRAVG